MHAENLLAGANAFTLADVHEAYRYVLSAPFTQPQSRHQQKVGYYLHAYRTVADLGFGEIKTRAALGATDPDAVAMAKGGSASVNYSKWGEEAANHLLMLES